MKRWPTERADRPMAPTTDDVRKLPKEPAPLRMAFSYTFAIAKRLIDEGSPGDGTTKFDGGLEERRSEGT